MILNFRHVENSSKSADAVLEALKNSDVFVEDQINKDIWVNAAGFRFRINPKKKKAELCRADPLWPYALLKIVEGGDGCVVKVRIVPSIFNGYFVLLLCLIMWVRLLFVPDALASKIAMLAILIIIPMNIYQQYKCFILLKDLAHRIAT